MHLRQQMTVQRQCVLFSNGEKNRDYKLQGLKDMREKPRVDSISHLIDNQEGFQC